jgi:hypothetical protein
VTYCSSRFKLTRLTDLQIQHNKYLGRSIAGFLFPSNFNKILSADCEFYSWTLYMCQSWLSQPTYSHYTMAYPRTHDFIKATARAGENSGSWVMTSGSHSLNPCYLLLFFPDRFLVSIQTCNSNLLEKSDYVSGDRFQVLIQTPWKIQSVEEQPSIMSSLDRPGGNTPSSSLPHQTCPYLGMSQYEAFTNIENS